jgi:cytochrome c553
VNRPLDNPTPIAQTQPLTMRNRGVVRAQVWVRVRVWVFMAVVWAAWPAGAQAQPAPAAPDAASTAAVRNTMAQRMQACVMCHGQEGRATRTGYFPRIAGKPEGYLFNQLKNFREGRRRNPAMRHLTQHMSDDYLRDIARYFSALDLPYAPALAHGLSEQQQQTAEQLVFKGVPERRIPACTACHGSSMAGRLPAMPGLLTLSADYLMAQLGAWRTDLRTAAAPDCMADIAKRLTHDEVSVVARWLSAQSPPAGTKPEAAAAQPLPVQCGSGNP